VVIDTNVARVVARLHALDRTVAEAQAEIRLLADEMTPADRSGDFAQAMMDLGAGICRPRKPLCVECPLAPACRAFESGDPEAYPAPKARRQRPHRHGIAWWIERQGAIWLVRRPAKGLLGGMAALPGTGWQDYEPSEPRLATVSHGFTHFTLDLHVVGRASPEAREEGWWQPLDRVGEAGLPTLYARAVEAVLARKENLAA
jgi:A/G-specific adenine glycosylase